MITKKRDFNVWLSKFRYSISDYKYYIDFDNVYKNVENIKIELNIMNTLIGCKNIEEEFENIVKKYPETLKIIPTLIAKREFEIYCTDGNGSYNYNFKKMNYNIEQYKYFMNKIGLFDLLQNHLINNLVDYVLGIETGLNSNGRKNRGGHLMEELVESFIIKAGFVKGLNYFKEMYLSDIEKITHLDLSNLSNSGNTAKRFDFVIITNKCTYACECNFYASSGSKLNETARSYKMIAEESKNIDKFKFVWFTDGNGWVSAQNNLKETFDVLENIYNIRELEEGILDLIIK